MTLKDFERELIRLGMTDALDLLAKMRGAPKRIAAPRRIVSPPMTPAMAAEVLRLRALDQTHCEIARALGVNQGRVSEVIKHGMWL